MRVLYVCICDLYSTRVCVYEVLIFSVHFRLLYVCAHMHKIPYLYRSLFVKEPNDYWLFCRKRSE